MCFVVYCIPCVSNCVKAWYEDKEVVALFHQQAYFSPRRWKSGLPYFSLKSANPHKSALLDFWPTQLPIAAVNKWPVFHQAPKRYKNVSTLTIFGRSYLSITKSVLPMAEQGQSRTTTEMWWDLSRMNSSSSWLCLFFQKSPLVSCSCCGAFSKPLGVKHACDSCLPGVSRGSCARTRVSAGLQPDCLLLMLLWENLLICQLHLHLLLLTHSTNPWLWDFEPKTVPAFFFFSGVSTVLVGSVT